MVLVLMLLLLQLLLFRPTVLAAKSRCCRATAAAADGRRNLVETILKDLVEVEGVLAPRPAAPAGLHHRDDGPGGHHRQTNDGYVQTVT